MNTFRLCCFLLPFIFLSLYSCEECTDCGPIDNNDPSVTISFINEDSLTIMNDLKKKNDDKLTAWNTRIAEIDDILKNQDLEPEETTTLRKELDSLRAERTQLQEVMKTDATLLNKISTGHTRIDSVSVVGGDSTISFPKKNSVFKLALRPDADSTTYLVVHNGRRDQLTLKYERTEPVLINGRVKILAKNVKEGKPNTFGKVEIIPDTTRTIHITTIKAYYKENP